MDEGSDVMVAGDSLDATPSSYINNTANVEEANSDNSHPEDYIVDPLCNPPADTYAAVTNDDDKESSTQEWLIAIKKDEAPVKDAGDENEEDGDEEDVGTSSFENLSPLSDDMQGSTKGFRKVLGILNTSVINFMDDNIYVCFCLNIYIHTYVRTYIYIYIHTYTHAHMHAYVHTYVYTCLLIYIQRRNYSRVC